MNADAALDRVLCLLDAEGFGAQLPQLALHTNTIEFGTIKSPNAPERIVSVWNTGPRCVRARIDLPDWLQVSTINSSTLPHASLQRLNLPIAHRRRGRASMSQSSPEPVITVPPNTSIDLCVSAFKRPGRRGQLRSPVLLHIADAPQPLQLQARARFVGGRAFWSHFILTIVFIVALLYGALLVVEPLFYAWQARGAYGP
ncbi:hypothetical protein HC891_03700 [Candidatus Gracilibacteria bacterium]|nr:hypothetical protein [Candidatus Gracilibacteria bacterium]